MVGVGAENPRWPLMGDLRAPQARLEPLRSVYIRLVLYKIHAALYVFVCTQT